MTHSPRILILTSSYGDGHLIAAYAVKQHFLRLGIEHVQVIDLMKEAHPVLNKISTAVYTGSFRAARYGINYYGWSYYMTQNSNSHSPLLSRLNRLGFKGLLKIISKEQPDVMINTFPYGAAPMIGRALGIPTFTIITDYFMHARWLHPGIDKYYVATNDLKKEFIANGIPEFQIEFTGIPIREAFETNLSSNENKRRKMILLVAGSHSVHQDMKEMISKLLALKGCHITVVCGRNKKLERFLNNQFQFNSDLSIFGFVEDINELMTSASCIISKAGGLTLAESLALQIPVFIYRPFAGQEKDNAIYFSKKGVAVISYQINELVKQIEHFISDEMYANQMRDQMAALHRKRAADTIANDILRSLQLYRKAAQYS